MRTRTQRTTASILVLVFVFFVMSAACVAPATPVPTTAPLPKVTQPVPAAVAPEPTKPAPPATVAPATVIKGGKLTLVLAIGEIKILDGQVWGSGESAMISSWVADTLVGADRDGKFKPYLATEWQVSEDGKTWTFKLRKDVKFQDGTAFDAEAVKFNFDRIQDPKTQSLQSAAMLGPVATTEVMDAYTFKVTYKEPYPRFLDAISQGFFPMWSPTAVKKYGPDEFTRYLVGSGPFMLKEYKPGEKYVLVKNPDYNWAPAYMKHQGPAYLDEVTFRFIAEAATAVSSLKNGEADIVMRFPEANAPEFRNNPKYQVLDGTNTGSPVLLVMNTTKPPLNDLKVRQAMEHAINQEDLVKAVMRGEADVTRGVMYPSSPCYWKDAEKVYPYDVKKAKALLEEAGWKLGADGIYEKEGKKLQFTVVLLSAYSPLGPVAQAQLKEIGADAKIDLVPGAVQMERGAKGDFNMIFQHMTYSDPVVLDMLYNSKNAKLGGWAWTGYVDPKLDDLLNKSSVTVDMAKRCELLTEAQKIIAQNALVLPMYGRKQLSIMTPRVKDFSFGPRAAVDVWLYNTYVEK